MEKIITTIIIVIISVIQFITHKGFVKLNYIYIFVC